MRRIASITTDTPVRWHPATGCRWRYGVVTRVAGLLAVVRWESGKTASVRVTELEVAA